MKLIRILILCLFLPSVCVNIAYAENEDMEYCLADFINSEGHFYCPCQYLDQYEFSWDGVTRRSDEDNLLVADGDGHLVLHKSDSPYQTAPIPATFEQGVLTSDLSICARNFFTCLDEECTEVEIPLSGGEQIYRGEVTFDDAHLKVEEMVDGSVVKANDYYYRGMLENGRANGIGKYCFGTTEDGQSFLELSENNTCPFPLSFQEGLWENGQFISGYSRILYETGGIYEGGFVLGLPHDWGKFLWPGGSRYFGEFNNGQRHGYGLYTYADGSIYEGEWQDNQKHGEGILRIQSQNIEYTGEFYQGDIQGYGTILFYDDLSYIGQFNNNAPHGKGLIIDKDEFYTAIFENGKILEICPITSQALTSFGLSNLFISKAYADTFSVRDITDRISQRIGSLVVWVKENKEHLINAAEGCASGAAGGATAGAVGGALAGTAVGLLAGGAGAVPGAIVGAEYGAAVGGINGCIEQAFEAFEYSKSHNGQYGKKQIIAAIKAEFNTENFIYGAFAGFTAAGGFNSLASEIGKRSEKVAKIIEKVADKIPEHLLIIVKYSAKTAKKVRDKLSKFDRGLIGVTTWNMRILSSKSYQHRDKEVIKKLFRSAAPYTSVFALQEVFDKKVVVDMIYWDAKIPFFPYISNARKWGSGKYYYVFLVNPLTRIINSIREDNMSWAGYDKKFSRKPYAITLKNQKYKAVIINNHIIYKVKEDNLDSVVNRSEMTAKKRVYEISEMYKIAKRKFGVKKDNIILVGDFNLEASNVFFAKFLHSQKVKSCLKAPISLIDSSSGGLYSLFDNDNSIFDAVNTGTTVAKKTNKTVNSYDHAIVNRGTICYGAIHDLSEGYDGVFYKDVSDHLPVTYMIKLEKTKKGK